MFHGAVLSHDLQWETNYKLKKSSSALGFAPCKGIQIPKSEKFFAFGFRDPEKFRLSNQESWALESGIQLKESGIPLTTKFRWQRLESSTWNPESTAWNPESKTVLDSLIWSNCCLVPRPYYSARPKRLGSRGLGHVTEMNRPRGTGKTPYRNLARAIGLEAPVKCCFCNNGSR